jgi:hypothetical protein
MEGMNWIDLAQDRARWLAVANAVMNLRVTSNADNFLMSEDLLDSKKGLCSIELVV